MKTFLGPIRVGLSVVAAFWPQGFARGAAACPLPGDTAPPVGFLHLLPEPGTVILLATGIIGLLIFLRRFQRRKKK